LLAAILIGSGIAAQQLSPGNVGLQLFENAAATATGVFAIILMFEPVSGAHFHPAVSLVHASFGGMSWRDVAAYIPAQVTGCITGAVLANAMFAKAAISISTTHRATPAHLLAGSSPPSGCCWSSSPWSAPGATAPAAVGAYIGAAYFFTSSTCFANPAISVGRMFSDTSRASPRPPSRPTWWPSLSAPASRSRSSARCTRTSPPAEAAEVIVLHTDEPRRSAHERRPGDHAIEPA
jgi:arsenate reductase